MAAAPWSSFLGRGRAFGLGVALLLIAAADLVEVSRAQESGDVSKGLAVTLKAPWEGTTLLHEAVEIIVEDDETLLWPFVDAWNADVVDKLVNDDHGGNCFHLLRDVASPILSETAMKFLKADLLTRDQSPKVDMFRKLVEQSVPVGSPLHDLGCCFLQSGNEVIPLDNPENQESLDPRAIESAHSSAVQPLLTIEEDHVVVSAKTDPKDGSKSVPTVILNAPLGSSCFSQAHSSIKAIAEQRGWRYIWRPVLTQNCLSKSSQQLGACASVGADKSVDVAGFGVELAIKNMEYKALDDTKVQLSAAERDSEAQAASIGEVRGFLFDQLLIRANETTRSELIKFKDVLRQKDTETQGTDFKLRAWQLDSMGLQATQRICDARNPIAAMQDITGSFPALAASLSKMSVSSALKNEVNDLQNTYGRSITSAPELFINGLRMNVQNVHLHSMLRFLKTEMKNTAMLSDLSGLSANEAAVAIDKARLDLPHISADAGTTSLSEAAREQWQPATRLCSILSSTSDIHALMEKVGWINNIEEDKAYQSMRGDINSLFPMNYFGMMVETGNLVPKYRKNLFNAVIFVNAERPMGVAALTALERILEMGEALRMGVVLFSTKDVSGSDAPLTLSQKLVRCYYILKNSAGFSKATKMLVTVWKGVKEELSSFDGDDALLNQVDSQLMVHFTKLHEKGKIKDSAFKALEQTVQGTDAKGKAQVAANHATNAATFAEKIGLSESDFSVTVNGMLAADANDLRRTFLLEELRIDHPHTLFENLEIFQQILLGHIVPVLKKEVQRARELYQSQMIASTAFALPTLLHDDNCVPRYNTELAHALGEAFLPSSPDLSGSTFEPIDLVTNKEAQRELLARGEGMRLDAENAIDAVASSGYLAIVGEGDSGWTTLCASAQHISSKGSKTGSSKIHSSASILPNPAQDDPSPLHLLLAAAPSHLSETQSLSILTQICEAPKEARSLMITKNSPEGEKTLWALIAEMKGFDSKELRGGYDAVKAARFSKSQGIDLSSIGLKSRASAIVSSSILIRVGDSEDDRHPSGNYYRGRDDLLRDDLLLIDAVFAYAQAGTALLDVLPGSARPNVTSLMIASSFLVKLASQQSQSSLILEGKTSKDVSDQVKKVASKCDRSCVSLDLGGEVSNQQKSTGAVNLVLLIDPLSNFAQKISPMLDFLQNIIHGNLTIMFWPKFGFDDLPIKTYYKYATPRWDDDEMLFPSENAAVFTSLPSTTTLSTQIDTPGSWLVGATIASLDLDNLRLEDLGPSVPAMHAEFEIESLIVSGSCTDITAESMLKFDSLYPRGMQLMLGTQDEPRMVDTMVMKNLGYFQLKALPGSFQLGLVPGCSSDMFHFPGTKPGTSRTITISSFDGVMGYELEVERVDPLEGDVLKCEQDATSQRRLLASEEESVEGKSNSWLSYLMPGSGGRGANLTSKKGDVLNIFSVASGHLYERFIRIMMLSVMKNTSKDFKVKFWFIKNYMSPKLKGVLPDMAKEYGFDYELITYKWPSWVVPQTEKQRIIWAYKILFLDVIFPMDLDRVIYVDADQIVRSDLMELQNMDIDGKPYAYTPFCDKPIEMDGFRFWKEGFWKNHLRGRNYHISALYLVDLQQFRMMGAGDELRIIYNGLARDPNSLANLDQDLPNYAQDVVPIFSLPAEWLYCETWCGTAPKSKAKTIDLCNNPMTKEPKLEGAKRIVPEWTALDEEQQAFMDRMERRLPQDERSNTSESVQQPVDPISSPHQPLNLHGEL